MLTKIIFVLSFIALVKCEIFNRPCRTVEEYGGAQTNFNYPAYSGLWYEIERYESSPNQAGGDCNQASYTTQQGGDFIYVVQYIQRNLETGIQASATGTSRLSFPDETPLRGLLNTTMTLGGPTDRSNYWILSTDYTTYSFVVNCTPVNATHSRENYWLFGRVHPLPQASRQRADEKIAALLDANRVRRTVQDFERCQL